MAAKSSRVTAMALSILCSASLRVSLINVLRFLSRGVSALSRGCRTPSDVPRDRGADLLTLDDPGDVPVLRQVEHDHVDVVVPAQADRGGVGHPETTGEELVVRELVELH